MVAGHQPFVPFTSWFSPLRTLGGLVHGLVLSLRRHQNLSANEERGGDSGCLRREGRSAGTRTPHRARPVRGLRTGVRRSLCALWGCLAVLRDRR